AIGAGLGLGLGTGSSISARRAAIDRMAADSLAAAGSLAALDSLGLADAMLGPADSAAMDGGQPSSVAEQQVQRAAAAPAPASASASASGATPAAAPSTQRAPQASEDPTEARLSRIVAAMEPAEAAELIGA